MNPAALANGNDRDVWRLRVDLHFRWVDGVGAAEGYWVVSDPLAGEWFCLTEIEKRLLDLADGGHSIRQLCQIAAATIKPLESSVDALVSFYAQARRKGLLVTVGSGGPIDRAVQEQSIGQGTTSPFSNRLGGWLGKIVAFRLPGLNPNAWFPVPETANRWTGSKAIGIGLVCLGAISIALVVAKFDVLTSELSNAFARRDPLWFVLLLVTIAVAKSIHELAHVVACRWVGAECRELGVMLLFGAPCLYCDVSDLWRVPRRSQRVLVSAAGMLAELCLAGLATMIWAVTHASIVHDLALVVMVVCCVSTVMINGNPLLRYDGYFILADWIGVPNLSQRAGQAMRNVIRKGVWGGAADVDAVPQIGRAVPTGALVFYAAASALYRVFVVGILTLLIYHGSVDLGLGWLGAAFAVALLGSMVLRAITSVLRSPDTRPVPDRVSNQQASSAFPRRWWNHRRATIVVTAVVVLLGIGLVIPFSRRVVVPVLVVAAEQQELHAIESGRIIELAESGAIVETGQVLIRLRNDELDDQLAQADAELAVATALVAAWQSRKGTAAENSAALAVAIKRSEAAEKHRRLVADRKERLTLVARSPGRFTHSIPRPVDARDRKWRCGQWVPSGTLMGWVGHPEHRKGVALVDQNQVDLIREGQHVRIRHASRSRGQIEGTVTQNTLRALGRAAGESIPPELFAGATDSESRVDVSEANYFVRITLEHASSPPLPLRSVALAEINVDPTSLWNRLRRIAASEYRGL
ncbi:Peptidase family M50 [Stieleria neptunia]|uniref:Peptidase family M50 n=1 Tax=Stieleria neptunia TaxID=2527979 RepID=A0A518HR86_9BACT|nr:biotin/lipoyl-binding protein [Stieleria neptunia]QDV43359.1 Peptidase family M50 [Stieleria neptunia]